MSRGTLKQPLAGTLMSARVGVFQGHGGARTHTGGLPPLSHSTNSSRRARRPPRARATGVPSLSPSFFLSGWPPDGGRRRCRTTDTRTPGRDKKDMPTTTTTPPRHLSVPSVSHTASPHGFLSPSLRPKTIPARTVSLRTAEADDDIMQTCPRDEKHTPTTPPPDLIVHPHTDGGDDTTQTPHTPEHPQCSSKIILN